MSGVKIPCLNIVEHYSDELSIVDDQGFSVIDVNRVAVLLDYANKLGIDHWADSPRASREMTDEEFEALSRRIVRAVNGWDSLVAQRDALVEALRELCDPSVCDAPPPAAIARARAALSQVGKGNGNG